jgi:hypothetical protein
MAAGEKSSVTVFVLFASTYAAFRFLIAYQTFQSSVHTENTLQFMNKK